MLDEMELHLAQSYIVLQNINEKKIIKWRNEKKINILISDEILINLLDDTKSHIITDINDWWKMKERNIEIYTWQYAL